MKKFTSFILCLLAFILLSAGNSIGNSFQQINENISTDYEITRLNAPNRFKIVFFVVPESDFDASQLNIILPKDILLIKGNTKLNGELKNGYKVELPIEIEINSESDLKIKGVLTAFKTNSKFSQVENIYFQFINNQYVYCTDKILQNKDQLKSLNLLSPDSFNSLLSNTTFNNSTAENNASDTIRAKGYVYYSDSSMTYQPLRYSEIEMVAKIENKEKILARTYTDEKGLFRIESTLENITSLDGIKAFIRTATKSVITDNENNIDTTEVIDGIFKKPYFSVSESFLLTDAINNTINIEMRIDEGVNLGACSVFQNCLDASNLSKNYFHVNKKRNIIWPSANTLTNDTIYIMQYDRWDSDVIFHEYAHFLDFNLNISKRATGEHYYDENLSLKYDSIYAKALAFSEGWADFFAVSLQYEGKKDSYYDDTEDIDMHVNLEGPIKHKGEDCEAAVSCILWDMFDSNSEYFDNVALGLKPVFYKLLEGNPTADIRKYIGKFEENEPLIFQDIIPIYKEYTGRDLATGIKNLSQTGTNSIDLVCFPNPFKNEITINYTLKEKGFVQLEIYNNLGQKIKTLVAENQNSMTHYTVKWNGTDESNLQIPEGIYYSIFKQNNVQRIVRIIKLK